MIQSRAFAASIRVAESTWWITGGENGDGALDTTEKQTGGGAKFEIAFNLPGRVRKNGIFTSARGKRDGVKNIA